MLFPPDLDHILATLLAFFLLAGCAMTRGTFVQEMDSTDPYRLTCSGEVDACMDAAELVLTDANFQLQSSNQSSSRLTASKVLSADERLFLSGPTTAATGARAKKREGTLAFAFAETDTSVTVEMKGLLTLAPSEREERESTPPDTTLATRGHPMMVRYGLALDDTDRMALLEPTSGRLKSERLQQK